MKQLRITIKVFFTLVILSILISTNANAKTNSTEFNKNELLINGEDAQSIVFLIVGDGFAEEEQDLFDQKAEEVKNYILDTAPFSSFKEYVNFYSLNVISKESGASESPSNLKDTYFQCSYNYAYNIERLLAPNNSIVYDLAASYVPYYDNIIMIVNDQRYGGSGGSISVTSINEDS